MTIMPSVLVRVKIMIRDPSSASGKASTYSLSLYTPDHPCNPSSAMAPPNPTSRPLHEILDEFEHSPYFVYCYGGQFLVFFTSLPVE